MTENWSSLAKETLLIFKEKERGAQPKGHHTYNETSWWSDMLWGCNPVTMERILNKRSTCKDFERISQAEIAPGEKLPLEDQSEHY